MDKDSLDFTPAEKPRVIAWIAAHFDEMDADKMYTVEIKEIKKRRSLDSNALAWAYMDKLAEVMHISKTEIYRGYMREIGGNSDIVCVKNEALEALVNGWGHGRLGWITETMPSKISGCTNVILYYGSSTFNQKQMNLFIDHIMQDCKQLGIKTPDEEEIDRIIAKWEGDASE